MPTIVSAVPLKVVAFRVVARIDPPVWLINPPLMVLLVTPVVRFTVPSCPLSYPCKFPSNTMLPSSARISIVDSVPAFTWAKVIFPAVKPPIVVLLAVMVTLPVREVIVLENVILP